MDFFPKSFHATILNQHCNERKLYGSYLLGLRKTRKLLKNNYTKNETDTIMKFTNNFISNHTFINNTDVRAKNIIMSNIVLDVSNIDTIEIIAKDKTLIIELDKNNKVSSIINNVNSVENIVSMITLFGKVMTM